MIECQNLNVQKIGFWHFPVFFSDFGHSLIFFCLFLDHDLLEEHLGHMHMATCFDFPDLFPDQWGFVKPPPPPPPRKEEIFKDPGKISSDVIYCIKRLLKSR